MGPNWSHNHCDSYVALNLGAFLEKSIYPQITERRLCMLNSRGSSGSVNQREVHKTLLLGPGIISPP